MNVSVSKQNNDSVENQLRESEERFRLICEGALDGIVSMDEFGRVTSWNHAAEVMFGYMAEEAVGKDLHALIAPERYRAAYQAGIAQFKRFGTGAAVGKTVELMAKRQDNTEFPIELSVSAIQLHDSWCAIGIVRDISQRKRMDEQVKRLAAIVETSGDAILSEDREGVVLTWNKAAEQLYGFTAEEMIGKSIALTFPVDGLPEFPLILQRVQLGETIKNHEMERQRKDGKRILVSLSLTPVKDDSGAVVRIITIARDITEQKKVRQEREWFAQIVDAATDLIAVASLDKRVTYLNPAGRKMVGIGLEEDAAHIQMRDYFSAEYFKILEEEAIPTALSKGAWLGDMEFVPRDGGRVSVSQAVLSNRSPDKNATYLFTIARDTTLLKALELEKRKIQDRFIQLCESAHDAIVSTDENGMITSWNRASERIYGYSEKDALGKSVEFIIPESNRAAAREQILSVLKGNALNDYESEHLRSNGSIFPVSITLSPIRNAAGDVIGISLISRDITERKEAEKRISEFYSVVSHELRTPLTSIFASLRLMEGGVAGAVPVKFAKLVTIARTECERLVRLVSDILDLNKAAAGKLNLRRREIDVRDIVERSVSSLEGAAQDAGVRIETDWKWRGRVDCDLDRSIQALTNILSNAIKFSPRDTVVTVSVTREESCLRISVVDRGCGISEMQMPKLFGKFQQLDSSDSRSRGGTGLGLAITKELMKLHGGKVGVESTPGKGSTFWLEFPNVVG